MKKLYLIICLICLTLIMSDIAKATIPVVWQATPNGSGVLTNSISRVKLTPDKNNVMVFHYNGSTYGIPTRVDKLDASTGNFVWPLPGYKTVTKPGERISMNGWVDSSGNLYIMPSWSGYTLWKYNSEFNTQLWSYTGGTGFEYVKDVITDEFDNVYIAGHVGSGSYEPSTLIKLTSSGSFVWSCPSRHYTSRAKEDYTRGMALDSQHNLFRVGTNYTYYEPVMGRLIGHRDSDGAEIVNYVVPDTSSEVQGITIDDDDYIYIGYNYNIFEGYFGSAVTNKERTVIQKLIRNGNTADVVWEYRFDDVGIFLQKNCIIKHNDNSFYVAFNQRQDGTTVPGIAEFDLDSNLLWKDTLDKPGWSIQSGIDVKGDYIYVGLTNDADGSQTQVLCLRKPDSEPAWSFVQMTDTHVGYLPKGKKNVSRIRLAKAIDYITHHTDGTLLPKFILVTGDIADYGCDGSNCPGCANGSRSIYADFKEAMKDAFANDIEVITIPGNHDRAKTPNCLAECTSGLEWYFKGLAGEPKLTQAGDMVSWDEGDFYFIGLDTGWTPSIPAGSVASEGFTDPQWQAFLDSPASKSTKPKVIFTHNPPFQDSSWILNWRFVDHLQDFKDFCNPENNNNVELVLSGHTHADRVFDITGTEISINSTTSPKFIQTPSTGKYDSNFGDDIPGYRVIKASGNQLYPQDYTEISDYFKDWQKMEVYSPANGHVYDSLGKHVGLTTAGQVQCDINRAYYFYHHVVATEDGNQILPEEIDIFDPCDDYLYEVIGNETGTYRLVLTSNEDGNETVFEANGIPTIPGAVHQYIVDWDLLAQGGQGVTVVIDTDGDGEPERTITSDSNLTPAEFDAPMTVTVLMPEAGDAVQDGITLTADANDADGIDKVYFYVREPNSGSGVPIGKEDLAGTFNSATGKWECNFNTTTLADGYYVVLAKGVDTYGNEGWSTAVPFSIRNWAIITMLPSTPKSKAGRTMPVKFSLRIAKSVDPKMPFVYNDELEIRIYNKAKPSVILQRSVFGSGSTNYRIDTIGEKYITNFKTGTKPATYVVQIWRPAKNFMVGSFTFATTK